MVRRHSFVFLLSCLFPFLAIAGIHSQIHVQRFSAASTSPMAPRKDHIDAVRPCRSRRASTRCVFEVDTGRACGLRTGSMT